MLRRKIDTFLNKWKNNKEHKPLIVKGARQIGKTFSIEHFASRNYGCVVKINFALQPAFRNIFDDGYEVDTILRNISILMPSVRFEPGDTLIFFDELQQTPKAATCLKAFCIDGRYDVICSGSLMGTNYNEIESNSVGYKEDYTMHSLDFEEFLWAKGYDDNHINHLLQLMTDMQPLTESEMTAMSATFTDYMITGGMPAVVSKYVGQGHFGGVLEIQRQLLLDYEEDITKYAQGLDKGKIKNIYDHIPVFLAKEYKKFQITKVGRNARSRDYIGTVEWLKDAGIIDVCYCLGEVSLPLKGNYLPNTYKIYYHDIGLLIASLDEEAQLDLRENRNFNTCKGAIYENVVAEMLYKQGYGLYFFRNEKSTLEMDFFIRDAQTLIPVEVKSDDGDVKSLNKLIDDDRCPDIRYGIKLCNRNIGFNGKFYTFPYFLTFLLKRWAMRGKSDK